MILFLSPHTDDIEFGCGGTLARFVKRDIEVMVVAFSKCQESIPEGLPKNTLVKEFESSMRHFGIDEWDIYNFPVRNFPDHRQAILNEIVNIQRNYEPDIVFLPSRNDTHQDHEVICQEGCRAFKDSSILGYEAPRNNNLFPTDIFIPLSERDLEKKHDAILQYESQSAIRTYTDLEYIKGLARVRGVQANQQYAEAFECIRWIYHEL